MIPNLYFFRYTQSPSSSSLSLEDEEEEGDGASDTSEFKLNSGRGLFTTKTDVDDSSFASTKEHNAGKELLSCRTAAGIPLLYCFMKTVAFSPQV